ncbi:MAG: uroporphyrinogen decarboxylase family protein [Lentisphaerota bacterium]
MNSEKHEFYAFISGNSKSPGILTAPIFGTYVASQRAKRAQIPLTVFDEHAVEDILDYSDECGVIPLVCVLVGDLHLFGSEWQLIKTSGEEETWRRYYNTREKRYFEEIIRRPGNISTVKHLLDNNDGYEILPHIYENLDGNCERAIKQLRNLINSIDQRGVVYLNVPLPHLLFGFLEDTRLIYSLFDEPEKMQRIFDSANEISERIIKLGLEAGVKVFFTATHGIIGPDLLMKYAMPYCKRWREMLDNAGAYLYLHECGKMKALIECGFYQDIRPHILEGFDTPPVGDIDDFAAVRKAMSPDIIFKGNLRMDFLQKGNPAEIRQQTLNVLNSVNGYRHLMGGACSLLTGTPPENVRAMAEAVNIYSN